jgi:AraC-like DNA-binding protein
MEQDSKILWVEKTMYPHDWGIKEHQHEYYHLFYCLSGDTLFFVNKQPYPFKKGVFVIVPPNTLHELQKAAVDTVSCYEIKFAVNDKYPKEDLIRLPIYNEGDAFVETLIAYIVENGSSRAPYFIKSVNCFLYTLISYLAKVHMVRSTEKPNSQLIDTSGFSDITIDIIKYIESNYMHPISLTAIAEHVDYNPNYICSLFKKDTGVTIIDYLNFVRIRRAADHFSYSDIDITQVCARVGFANVSHFNRTFKKFVGLSPRIYRRMFPLDINGTLGKNSDSSEIEGQILTIAQAFGALNSSQAANNGSSDAGDE